MHLDAVYINRVLVKRTAAHIVLAAQLIRLTNAGESDQQTLDTTAGSIRHHACRTRINMIHRTLRMLDTAHLDFCQHLFVCQQLYIDIQYIPKVQNTLLHRGITDHRETQYHRIAFLYH